MARRFDRRDFSKIAESIKSELDKRKHKRQDLERHWKEVDRQVSMKPPEREKRDGTDWMPDMELPLQAQALEVLTADARRLIFPKDKDWFRCHAKATDEYLRAVQESLVMSGDETEQVIVPTQSDLNTLTESILVHFHSQYDFRAAIDSLNIQAFKYGTYVAHVRWAKREVFSNDFRGIYRERDEMPVVVPGDIKTTYLDTSAQMVAREGMMIAPSIIREYKQKLADLKLAAKVRNPQSMSGGWMPGNISRLQAEDGHVKLIEMEGDLIIPRSQTDGFIPNCIVTIAMGANLQVVRYRENPYPFRLFQTGTYHMEDNGVYGVSPLMKGVPIQMAATEAMNRLMQTITLNTEPPIWYDPNDQYWRAQGGPKIEPRALWSSLTKPEPIAIGNPSGMMQIYFALLKQYEELTGVTAPRLGAQTKSHQTAFAVDMEVTRGQTRTVDYVQCFTETLTNILHMELEMLRKGMEDTSVFIPKYAGYVDVTKEAIPTDAYIEVYGSASPSEKREQEQKEFSAFQMLLQLDPMVRQLGGRGLDMDAVRTEVMRRANPGINLDNLLEPMEQSFEPPATPEGIPPELEVEPGLFTTP